MEQNKQLSLQSASISGKKVTADFTGGDVTSDVGVLVMKETANKIGIIENLTKEIHYQAGTWHRALRIIIMAEVSVMGENLRFVVTSLEHEQSSFMYEAAALGKWETLSKNTKSRSEAVERHAIVSLQIVFDLCNTQGSSLPFYAQNSVKQAKLTP